LYVKIVELKLLNTLGNALIATHGIPLWKKLKARDLNMKILKIIRNLYHLMKFHQKKYQDLQVVLGI